MVKKEREKGVDDGFCLSTNPTERQLGASYATIDARMVVLKGSVNRHSQSRSPTSQICHSSTRCRARASSPPPLPTRTAAPRDALLGANQASQPPPCPPCAQRARACHGTAGWGEGGASSWTPQEGKLEIVEGVQGHRASCRTPPATPRTLPDTRNRPPMRLAKPQVAAPTPSMRIAEGGVCIIIIICAHPSRTPRLQSHDWESGHSRNTSL